MSVPAGEDCRIDKLYDSLSRYQWWRRWWSRARPGSRLEIHKRLREATEAGYPGAGHANLNDWLWRMVCSCRVATATTKLRVLDIGSGFGATVLTWAQRGSIEAIGLTLSDYERRKATRQALRLGLDRTCFFRQQSFDDPSDLGTFDVLVSIESLFHAADLHRTIRGLGALVRPGGVIACVEDMAVDESTANDPVARELLSRWATDELKTVADYREAFGAAGFAVVRDVDLTDQVDLPSRGRDRRERCLTRIRKLMPIGRGVIDAFLGGIAMERLYSDGRLSYRAMLAIPVEDER